MASLLFPDAKLPEDFAEDFVGGDGVGGGCEDGVNVADGGAQVLGEELFADAITYGANDSPKAFHGAAKGVIMPCRRDDYTLVGVCEAHRIIKTGYRGA